MRESDSAQDAAARRLPAGVGAALLAAALFGAGTPLAKALMGGVGPWMLAGLLYLGSGMGLAALRPLYVALDFTCTDPGGGCAGRPLPGSSPANGPGWPARPLPAAWPGRSC